ncbi:unnamed protein product [Rhodiola kirilowii]
MESNTGKRPKSKSKPSRRNPSSSSTLSTLVSLTEPSPDFFPSKSDFLRLVTVIAIAALVAVACNFVFSVVNQQPRPFCDSEVDYDDSASDYCEPCPRNGECHNGELECAKGYRLIGRLCVEDGVIAEKAKKISELVETFVCKATARSMCDGSGAHWVNEEEMWNKLDETRLVEILSIEESLFPLAKQKSIQSIYNILETKRDLERVQELKCPDSLAEKYKSHGCRMREWSSEHASLLMPILSALVGCTLVLQKFRRRKHLASRAEELYQQVCDTLEENALMSRNNDVHGEPWVVASWLRDHLLQPRERRDSELWKKVEELVQEDSRLDRYPKLVKGEAKVVWEWQVEGGSLSSSRKKRKGMDAKSTIPQEETPDHHYYSKMKSPGPLFG